MKDKVKDMFEKITMPEDTARKIQAAMEQPRPRKKPLWVGRTVAAAAMLALVLSLSPQARAATGNLVRYVFGGWSSIVMDEETGKILEVVSFPMEEKDAAYLESKDGRLYLTVKESRMDITDQTSMEVPFIYTYVDSQNVEHMLIIGGVPENFGVSEFYREKGENLESWQGWIGGYSDNYFDNTTEEAYPWLANAWEKLNLPWPLPGGGRMMKFLVGEGQ